MTNSAKIRMLAEKIWLYPLKKEVRKIKKRAIGLGNYVTLSMASRH